MKQIQVMNIEAMKCRCSKLVSQRLHKGLHIGSLILLLCLLPAPIFSQTKSNYSLRGEYIYGEILKHTTHLNNLVKGPVQGAEMAIEWQTMGEKPWHKYFNYPKLGIGVVALDLGNPDMLGQLMAVYPYLKFKLIDKEYLKGGLKGGAGASFLNKRYNNTPHLVNTLNGVNNEPNQANAAIGSILNVYFAGGGFLEVPLYKGFSLNAEYTWNHASNGSFYQPNSGINMLNAIVGISYTPSSNSHRATPLQIEKVTPKYQVEIIAAGGARELYYKDNKMFPTGSLVVAVYRKLGNCIRIGAGVDGFYDGAYDGNTAFKRTYLSENKLNNKIRVGASLQPELVFGNVTMGMHVGIYLYNPLRNLEPYEGAGKLNKPLIYPYNIEKEDGWLYTRAALKYAFAEHYFVSLGLKTHLQKAEFIEWGLGYRF